MILFFPACKFERNRLIVPAVLFLRDKIGKFSQIWAGSCFFWWPNIIPKKDNWVWFIFLPLQHGPMVLDGTAVWFFRKPERTPWLVFHIWLFVQCTNPDAPWCWNIYLHNWAILGVSMLVNIPAPWILWVIIYLSILWQSTRTFSRTKIGLAGWRDSTVGKGFWKDAALLCQEVIVGIVVIVVYKL